MAVFNAGLKRARSVHRVQDLEAQTRETGFSGSTGIALVNVYEVP